MLISIDVTTCHLNSGISRRNHTAFDKFYGKHCGISTCRNSQRATDINICIYGVWNVAAPTVLSELNCVRQILISIYGLFLGTIKWNSLVLSCLIRARYLDFIVEHVLIRLLFLVVYKYLIFIIHKR